MYSNLENITVPTVIRTPRPSSVCGCSLPSSFARYSPSHLYIELPKPNSEAASSLLRASKMDHQTSRRRLQAQYLTLYNFISAILWLAILGRVVLLVPLVGFKNVYGGVGAFAKWTQTLALLEVVHSASGEPSVQLERSASPASPG